MVISAEILKASSAGDWSSVEAEINSGAFSVNDQMEVGYSDNGETLLCYSLKVLDNGETPLAFVRKLLEFGADPNISRQDGSVPLHFASHPDQAALLLAYGAEVDPRDSQGQTPLLWRTELAKDLHFNDREIDRLPDLVRTLLRHGADYDAQDSRGIDVHELAQRGAGWKRQQLRERSHGLSYSAGLNEYFMDQVDCFEDVRDLIEALRAAGSWKRLCREPFVQLQSLRYLCLAERAFPPPALARCFGLMTYEAGPRTRGQRKASGAARAPLPDDVFKLVLSFGVDPPAITRNRGCEACR